MKIFPSCEGEQNTNCVDALVDADGISAETVKRGNGDPLDGEPDKIGFGKKNDQIRVVHKIVKLVLMCRELVLS